MKAGLYYYNARYYDPELGRFIQPDTTIPDLSVTHRVTIDIRTVLTDPLRYTDPDGRAPSDWANAWSGAMNRGATYVSAGPSHWIYNGTIGSINSLVGGLAEPLRFGSTAGALSGSGHATAGQIALGTLQEAGRAAALVPVGAAIGKGTGALVTSLTAGGEEEVVGEVAGVVTRTGPRGVDPSHHNANITVRDASGNIISHDRVVSGNMTPEEQALGFPQNTLASHTEARAVRGTQLEEDQSMTITGQNPPCPSCKGAMNRAAGESGATIKYQWRQGGKTQTWQATPKQD